ncbi:MAG TPA: dihydrolipoamide acetyltransferase family protein [Planctomycetota bacterium]|nr:dihydrolipoamide acetyltransferase family protein [Planctomycetota bacterium]HRR80631.1 dihydrolipoamide acetyltransferase family protein [Planctomycetota bacterium]HRT97257.1 dihydrolipoamide acetyltransferase family protein [Planctomycetota bacterium]
MPTDVVMPHMGESVVEGKVLAWLKRPGDPVEADEPLVEIETDKITVEVPSPSAGVLLEALAREGQMVKVGERVAIVGAKGEKPAEEPAPAPKPTPQARPAPAARPAPPPKPAAPAPPEPPKPAPEPPALKEAPAAGAAETPLETGALGVYASPAVRRFARESGVDLRTVQGTGRLGRITREDVERALQPAPAAPAPPEAAAAKPRTPDVDQELVPLTPMRRAIAEHMVRSKTVAPHVTTVAEADMTAVAALKDEWRAAFGEQGVKLTYTPFVLSAVARALRDHPELNAEWTDKGILLKYRIHLGVAVAVENGLVVPVIKDADRLSLVELARAAQTLAEKARAGKIAPGDLSGGTFTITNPGVFGAVLSTPIIHQPQAAILATGRIAEVPAVINNGIAIRKRMFLSLSYDHRIVDGAAAARFLQRIREILEKADFQA